MFKIKGLGVRNTIDSAKLQEVIEGFSSKTSVSFDKKKAGLNFYNGNTHIGYIRFSEKIKLLFKEGKLTASQLVKAAQEQPLVSAPYKFTDANGNPGEISSFLSPAELRSQGISVADLVAKATPISTVNATTELVF